jgi:hypothetical protein
MLLGAGWATGVALALYGALGLINGGLAQVGAVQPVDANAARWYFVLWGPIWLLGGLLMLATVRRQMRLGHGKATTSARLSKESCTKEQYTPLLLGRHAAGRSLGTERYSRGGSAARGNP